MHILAILQEESIMIVALDLRFTIRRCFRQAFFKPFLKQEEIQRRARSLALLVSPILDCTKQRARCTYIKIAAQNAA